MIVAMTISGSTTSSVLKIVSSDLLAIKQLFDDT